MQLTQDEVLSATLSLYADRLKPYGRILLMRIGERACAQSGASSPPFICAKELRALCERSSRLTDRGLLHVLKTWRGLKSNRASIGFLCRACCASRLPSQSLWSDRT